MLNKEEFDNEIQKGMDNIVNGQTVSQRTLKDMDGAMSNFKSVIVSEPIDLSDF